MTALVPTPLHKLHSGFLYIKQMFTYQDNDDDYDRKHVDLGGDH